MDSGAVEKDLVEVLFTEKQILERLGELAQEIERDYAGIAWRHPLLAAISPDKERAETRRTRARSR